MNVLVLSFIVGMSINGMQAFMYAVTAHSYPTEIRGSAVGLAQTISRIGGVLSPIVASAYLAMKPLPDVNLFFWFVAVCALVTTHQLLPDSVAYRAQQEVTGRAAQVRRYPGTCAAGHLGRVGHPSGQSFGLAAGEHAGVRFRAADRVVRSATAAIQRCVCLPVRVLRAAPDRGPLHVFGSPIHRSHPAATTTTGWCIFSTGC